MKRQDRPGSGTLEFLPDDKQRLADTRALIWFSPLHADPPFPALEVNKDVVEFSLAFSPSGLRAFNVVCPEKKALPKPSPSAPLPAPGASTPVNRLTRVTSVTTEHAELRDEEDPDLGYTLRSGAVSSPAEWHRILPGALVRVTSLAGDEVQRAAVLDADEHS